MAELQKQKVYIRTDYPQLSTSGTIANLKEVIGNLDYPDDQEYNIEYGEDYFEFTLPIYREETESEFIKRCNDHNKWIEEREKKEYENFLKLKEKYEKKDLVD